MAKYFITFGSNHLQNFSVPPMSVMLELEGDSFNESRNSLMKDEELGIKEVFAFQYDIGEAEEMTQKYGMKLYTREELLKLKKD